MFVLDYLDDTVKTPDDVTAKLKMPLLGLVPKVRGDEGVLLSQDVAARVRRSVSVAPDVAGLQHRSRGDARVSW